MAARAIAEPALAPLGLGPKGFGALAILVREGPLSQQRLGAKQGVDRTTTVAVVDELERAGFVERRRDPSDRRAYSLQPTAKGRRVLERAAAPLSAADRLRLKQLLRALLEP